MKYIKILTLIFSGFLLSRNSQAQTSFTASSGNWSTPGNWSAGVPDIADAVTIPADRIITVDVNAECASIAFTAGALSSSITLASGISLNVVGNIAMTNPTVNNTIQSVDVANGVLTCSGITMTNSSDSTRRNRLDINNGIVNVSTTYAMSGGALGENQLRFFGNGKLIFSGATFGLSSNDTYIRGNGTIEFNRNGNTTLGTNVFYNRIIVSGTGNKTLSSNSTNKLFINENATALINNTFKAEDSTVIDGTLSITSTSGSRTFNGRVIINNTGVWSNTGNESINFANGITNNGTLILGTGTHTFVTNEQNLDGNGPFLFGGAVTINSPAIVYNYDSTSVTGTFKINAGAIWVNQENSQLRFGGIATLTGTLTCFANGNAVHFERAGTQTVPANQSFYNLYKSNSNTLTLGAGTTNVNGVCIVNTGCTLICGANTLDIAGNLGGDGAITQSSGTIKLAGDNINTGAFTPSSGTFIYDGANQIVKSTTYNNLTIDGSNLKTLSGDVTVSGMTNLTTVVLYLNGNRLTLNGLVNRTSGLIKGSETSNISVGGSAANAALFFLQTDSSTRSLSNLTSTRANGTTISNALEIVDSINVFSGSITSAGNLTLRSTINNTARVARIVSGGIVGNVIAQRFIPGGIGKRKWRYLSSPINLVGEIKIAQLIDDVHVTGVGGIANGFDDCASCAPSLRTYTESTIGDVNQGWTNPTDTSTTITTGTGFELFVRGNRNTPSPFLNWSVPNNAIIDFVGEINSGVVNINIPYTDNGLTEADGFNLVGNPYPSQIDWLSSGWTKTNLDLFFWTYNPNPVINAYGIFSTVLGTGTNGISQFISSGQGFFVKANAAAASLGFTENIKRNDLPFNFFKTTNVNNSIPYFKLNAYNEFYSDELIIALDSTASNAIGDVADAVKFFGSNLNFYSKSVDSKPLAINQTDFPTIAKVDTIDLSFFSYEATTIIQGTYTIELSSFHNLPPSLKIDIIDNYTNSRINLNTANNFSFNVTNDLESFGNNRFDLVMYYSSVGINHQKLKSEIKIYPNPTSTEINILNIDYLLSNTKYKSQSREYKIYNSIGKVVLKGSLVNNKIDVRNLLPGVYILKLESGSSRFVKTASAY